MRACREGDKPEVVYPHGAIAWGLLLLLLFSLALSIGMLMLQSRHR